LPFQPVEYWEPERTVYEMQGGMVFITYHTGTSERRGCTTVAGFERELAAGEALLNEFRARQRNVIAEIRKVAGVGPPKR
jgi:hypothetical protein